MLHRALSLTQQKELLKGCISDVTIGTTHQNIHDKVARAGQGIKGSCPKRKPKSLHHKIVLVHVWSNLFLSLQVFIDFQIKMDRHRVQIFYIHEKYFMNVKYKISKIILKQKAFKNISNLANSNTYQKFDLFNL